MSTLHIVLSNLHRQATIILTEGQGTMGPGNDHSHGVWGGGKLCFWQKKMKERLHIWHGNKTTIIVQAIKGIRVCIPPFALKHFFSYIVSVCVL